MLNRSHTRFCAHLGAYWLIVLTLTTCCGSVVTAGDASAAATPHQRRLLAFYDSREQPDSTAEQNNIVSFLEAPLNHLGMIVDYRDVNQRPLPDITPYHGILIWFTDDRMKKPEAFCRWLTHAVGTKKKRALIIGGLGAAWNENGKATDAEVYRQTLAAIGLRVWSDADGDAPQNPFALRLRDTRPKRFQFETKIPPREIAWTNFRAVDPNMRVWRAVVWSNVSPPKHENSTTKKTPEVKKDTPRKNQEKTSIAVATSARGGFVSAASYILRTFEKPTYSTLWDIDPYAFLTEVFGLRDRPRLDITTAFGLRAAYSHIDGDGFRSLSRDIPGKPRPAAEVIDREILARYPFPITLGIVVGDVDPRAGFANAPAHFALAKKMLARPHIQAGCHGYAHPLNWAKGKVALQIKGYKFTAKQETIGAMDFINRRLLPKNKRVAIFLWTGDCSPTPAQVALVEGYGVPNMNGGDLRFDALHPSVSYLCPHARRVGKYLQVHTSAANDYLYTDEWRENFGGFQNVIETYKRSESPRRLLPVNIYYHLYSGERLAALRALKAVYEWCGKQPLNWLHAAEYAQIVHDSQTARTGDLPPQRGVWVEDYGLCQTVRLDANPNHIDLNSSVNVLGYTHHAGALYVTLAPGKRAEIVLWKGAKPPRVPSLVSSTARLRRVVLTGINQSMSARVYQAGRIILRGYTPGMTLRVKVGAATMSLRVDVRGRLTIPLTRGRGEWREVLFGP